MKNKQNKRLGAWGNSPNQHKRQDRKMFKVEHLTYSDLFVFEQVYGHLLCPREQSSPQRGWVSGGHRPTFFYLLFLFLKAIRLETITMKEVERTRPERIEFRTTAKEKAQLKKNMRQAGYEVLGSYLLKMGLEGVVVNVDFSEIRGSLGDIGSLRNEFNRIGNNINQVTKHVNESHEIDAMDLYLLQEEVSDMKKQIERFEKIVVQRFNETLKQLGVD